MPPRGNTKAQSGHSERIVATAIRQDAALAVLAGASEQPEAADPLPLDDVVQSSARRVGSVALQNAIIIAMIERRLLRDLVPFGRCLRHQFAKRPRVAIVAPEQPIL